MQPLITHSRGLFINKIRDLHFHCRNFTFFSMANKLNFDGLLCGYYDVIRASVYYLKGYQIYISCSQFVCNLLCGGILFNNSISFESPFFICKQIAKYPVGN